MKRDLVGRLFLVAVLFVSGCRTQVAVDSSDGVRVCRMEQRECHFDDAPYAEMSWKEFRPFRVLVPHGVEVKCCCMDEGRMAMSVPGVAAPVIVCVLDRSSDSIGLLIKLHQLAADDSRVRGMLPACEGWYVEKKFSDRRLVIEHRMQGEQCEGLTCYCEFAEGATFRFSVRGSGAIRDEEIDYFLKLCKVIVIKEHTSP